MGMSRCGFLASCAAVETASKPMYAKKITPAARSTPPQPNGGAQGRRNKWLPVLPIDIGQPDGDERQDYRKFNSHDDVVEGRGLLDAEHEQDGDNADNEHSGNVEHSAGAGPTLGEEPPDVPSSVWRGRVAVRRRSESGWNHHAEILQEGDDVARPTDGDGGGRKQILKNQVPANDPGHELPQRGVAVSVGGPGYGNHGRELGITKPSEGASHPRQHEREDNRRTGVFCCRLAREHEDARADDCTDTQSGQVHWSQRPFEAMVGEHLGLQVGNPFSSKEIHAQSILGKRVIGPG